MSAFPSFFPQEIFEEIVLYVRDSFRNKTHRVAYPSKMLLVSRQWYAAVLPVFYRHIDGSELKPRDVQILHETLMSRSDLATLVRVFLLDQQLFYKEEFKLGPKPPCLRLPHCVDLTAWVCNGLNVGFTVFDILQWASGCPILKALRVYRLQDWGMNHVYRTTPPSPPTTLQRVELHYTDVQQDGEDDVVWKLLCPNIRHLVLDNLHMTHAVDFARITRTAPYLESLSLCRPCLFRNRLPNSFTEIHGQLFSVTFQCLRILAWYPFSSPCS